MSSRSPLLWLLALTLFLVGCSRDPNEKPVITSGTEYRDTLNEAGRLSLSKLRLVDSGGELTTQDKMDLKKAALLFDALCDFQPTNIATWTGAGKIYLVLEVYAAAAERFKQGLATVPPKPIPEVKDTAIETHYLYAKALFNLHDYKTALDEANDAVEMFPNSPIYLSQRAAILIQLGQKDDARKDLTAALKLDPEHKESRSLMKLLLLEESERQLQAAVKLLNQKDAKGAVAAATKGLDIAPDYPPLIAVRAAGYIELGQMDKARADVNHLEIEMPDSKDLPILKQRLK